MWVISLGFGQRLQNEYGTRRNLHGDGITDLRSGYFIGRIIRRIMSLPILSQKRLSYWVRR
jgi:hypothetical protein